MMTKILIVLVAVVIFFGGRYAWNREELRDPVFIRQEFQKINHDFFGDQLDVTLLVGLDDGHKGLTIEDEGGNVWIALDVSTSGITSKQELQDVLRHESCHAFLGRVENDPHGPQFQECMRRYGR